MEKTETMFLIKSPAGITTKVEYYSDVGTFCDDQPNPWQLSIWKFVGSAAQWKAASVEDKANSNNYTCIHEEDEPLP
jgi:hypothetical protein